MLKSFTTAISFLTIIRVPFTCSILGPAELAASFACFPLAGLLLGAIYAGTALLFAGLMPTPVLSVLICTLMVAFTRGLHLDGLADLGDGIWGGHTPERRLEIMKDSNIGAFGVLALILVMTFKITSIHALIEAGNIKPLILAPVLARFAMVAAAQGSTHARPGGLGKPFLEFMRPRYLAIAGVFSVVAVVASGPGYIVFFVPALAAAAFYRIMTRRLLGGMTGDVFGAVSETTEVLVLVLGTCLKAVF